PLFFLDYLGTGKLEPHVFKQIIKGFVKGCAENGCALIGGETAQMPGFYQPGEYDVSGTIVGVVEKSRMLDGKKIRRGDAIIGIASSGLHTNGYSLGRQIFFEKLKMKPTDRVPELKNSIGAELLKVHVTYGPLVQGLLKKFNVGTERVIRGLAHITGGGFVDNIPRVLPRNVNAVIRKNSWEMLPIFDLILRKGGVPEPELYQVFNMGIGMTAIVQESKAEAVLKQIKMSGHAAWIIGEVSKGSGVVEMV
ncbi:MAG: phosphoribosylformylglycinamidine cyclo-ligase, partial [Verrucomicrobiota bacterium]|nr:phosphoribosylformylglycinamidine cyclo-ligase [Verrucomicrobiota bacterium]